MKKTLLTIISVLILTIGAISQQKENVAPIKWENYKISEENVSVIFPKLPVKTESEDSCARSLIRTYYAYADEIVYRFKIIKKTNKKRPDYCVQAVRQFGKVEFSDYIREAKSEFVNPQVVKRGENVFIKSESETDTLKISKWMYDDDKNFRLFLFDVSARKGKTTNEEQFIDSLKFSVDASAVEINKGVAAIIGDESAREKTENDSEIEIKTEQEVEPILPLILVVRAKPVYTDEARQNNVTGEVKLKMTFLQNGSVGNIEVVKGLDKGLTEKAIEAARKMAFIPSKRGERNLVVTKVVIFNFTIY